MIKIYTIPLMLLFTGVAYADVDTKTIDNATTVTDAISAYKTLADGVIKTAQANNVDATEIESAQTKINERINTVNAAVSDGTFYKSPDSDNDDSKPDTNDDKQTDPSNDQKTESQKPGLTAEQHQAKIDELQKNADAMHEKEHSTANKLIGAAGIGMTGIGGMQLLSGKAEQSADQAAEQEMQAYLNTFRCDYGGGKTFRGGEREIELPGAGVLTEKYNEYITLASDLKARKESLGMMPGIESEEIIDSVTSGLYDDVGVGITDGVYTSISRALLDENGEDAAEFAAQKQDAESQVKTGTALAVTGAAGSMVANMIVNKDAPKEQSAQINSKYTPGDTTTPAESPDTVKTPATDDVVTPVPTPPTPAIQNPTKTVNTTVDTPIKETKIVEKPLAQNITPSDNPTDARGYMLKKYNVTLNDDAGAALDKFVQQCQTLSGEIDVDKQPTNIGYYNGQKTADGKPIKIDYDYKCILPEKYDAMQSDELKTFCKTNFETSDTFPTSNAARGTPITDANNQYIETKYHNVCELKLLIGRYAK